MKASEYQPTYRPAILLLGPPKTGKTTLASQLDRPFIVDCASNVDGVVQYCRTHNLSLDFEFEPVGQNSLGVPIPRQQRFERMMKLIDSALSRPDIGTIVLDDLTAVAEIVVDKVRVDQGRAFGDLSGTKATDKPLEIQDWNQFYGIVYQLIMKIRSSNKALVLPAHTKGKEDSWGDVQEVLAIYGKAAEFLGGIFTDVWLLEIETSLTAKGETSQRYIRTIPKYERQQKLGLGTPLWDTPRIPLDLTSLLSLMTFKADELPKS